MKPLAGAVARDRDDLQLHGIHGYVQERQCKDEGSGCQDEIPQSGRNSAPREIDDAQDTPRRFPGDRSPRRLRGPSFSSPPGLMPLIASIWPISQAQKQRSGVLSPGSSARARAEGAAQAEEDHARTLLLPALARAGGLAVVASLPLSFGLGLGTACDKGSLLDRGRRVIGHSQAFRGGYERKTNKTQIDAITKPILQKLDNISAFDFSANLVDCESSRADGLNWGDMLLFRGNPYTILMIISSRQEDASPDRQVQACGKKQFSPGRSGPGAVSSSTGWIPFTCPKISFPLSR